MTTHIFDVVAFRAQFPMFADPTKYPDAALSGYFSMATCSIGPTDNCAISGDCLQLALDLMTAHIASLMASAANGSANLGIKTSASVDKVSIGETAPPFGTSMYRFWLSKSPYGQQVLFILDGHAAGGFYFNGIQEEAAFRKAGGGF